MATIGLYDIDFNHGKTFSLSLPLMKAYTRFINEGHVVEMMKPYEKTGRYNQIFYFKDNPSLKIPNGLTINSEKGTMVGYGFYGKTELSQKTMDSVLSFLPYDMNENKIKNVYLYRLAKNNNLIDWRSKDFTYTFSGKAHTLVNDRDFLSEPDWEELFDHYDNSIEFIHTLRPESYEQAKLILEKDYGHITRIEVPFTFNLDKVDYYLSMKGVRFDDRGIDNENLFMFIFAVKTYKEEKLYFHNCFSNDQFRQSLYQWAAQRDRISFASFIGNQFDPMLPMYYNFKQSLLLRQDPTKFSHADIYNEIVYRKPQ